MSDLISREEAIDVLETMTEIEEGIEMMYDLPAIEKKPVIHGEWIPTHAHIWKTDENGEIDMFAYDNDIHNGPVCVICGEYYCINCNPNWENSYCAHESYKCSRCENHVKVKTPYCSQCGVKMKEVTKEKEG